MKEKEENALIEEGSKETVMTKEPPMENVPLFGEDDLIINTLEFELAKVKDSIQKAVLIIRTKEIQLDDLKERRDQMIAAIDVIYDRHKDDKGQDEAPTQGEEDPSEEPEGFTVDEPKPNDDLPEEVAPED